MVLFDNIVEILALPDLDLRSRLFIDGLDPGSICAAFIYIDLLRLTVIPNGLLQEPLCSFDIALCCEKEVNGFTGFVNSPVEVPECRSRPFSSYSL